MHARRRWDPFADYWWRFGTRSPVWLRVMTLVLVVGVAVLAHVTDAPLYLTAALVMPAGQLLALWLTARRA